MSCRWPLFIIPENIRKPEIMKWVKWSVQMKAVCKKCVLKNLVIWKRLHQGLFFNKVAGLRSRCFVVNFAKKFLRKRFPIEDLRWLLLCVLHEMIITPLNDLLHWMFSNILSKMHVGIEQFALLQMIRTTLSDFYCVKYSEWITHLYFIRPSKIDYEISGPTRAIKIYIACPWYSLFLQNKCKVYFIVNLNFNVVLQVTTLKIILKSKLE